MSGNRIIESIQEAVAIAQGTMPEGVYTVHIPESVIRRIGYASTKEEGNSFCTHGFRGMASTTLNQHPRFQHLKHDWIEFQLAHAQRDKIRAAYNIFTQRSYLDERRVMVQDYADFLDELRAR